MRAPIIAAVTIALVAVPVLGSSALAGKPKCNGKVATIVGTNGRDTIYATNKADVIVAKGGADKIKARGGNDTICAGGGDDWIQAGGGKDKVFGGSGNDVISGNDKNDKLFGGPGLDNINGGPGADVVKGEGNSDLLNGGGGNDVVGGGAGRDDVQGGRGADRVYGGDGIDRLVGDEGVDVLNGGADTDLCVDDFVDTHVNCETADFRVKVDGPDSGTAGVPVEFSVEVNNYGPDASTYRLKVSWSSGTATCTSSSAALGTHREPLLPATDNHTTPVVVTCDPAPSGSSVSVDAYVTADAYDPGTTNDSSSFRVTFP